MKAVIKNGRIIKINSGNTEIGKIPKGSAINEMYWTGTRLVNLSKQNEFWVESKDGMFRLHAIQVPYSQLVVMNYKDRKKLWNDNGTYKIKSDEQIQNELNFQYRGSHMPKISDELDIILKYYETKTDLTDELQDLINDWRSVKEKYPKVVEKVSKI